MPTCNRLVKNFERAGGDLYSAGIDITENQSTHFALLYLKIAPMSVITKNAAKHFENTVAKSVVSLQVEWKGKGVVDIIFKIHDRNKFTTQVCDFYRGCTFAIGRLKRLRNFQQTEITCAARSNASECRYRWIWTPAPTIVEYVKSVFLFRFSSQKAILTHMEETYNKLQEANIDLERKVAEQTADIRKKNTELEQANRQLRESERMKDLLTGTLVHDIKNHIFSIAGDVKVLARDCSNTAPAQEIISHTAEACSSAMSLACNMLDIGKMEEGKLHVEPEFFDFDKLTAILNKYTHNILFFERQISVTINAPIIPLRFSADYLPSRPRGAEPADQCRHVHPCQGTSGNLLRWPGHNAGVQLGSADSGEIPGVPV
jgi:hypothetical protein